MPAYKFSSGVTTTLALLASMAFSQAVSAQRGSEQTGSAPPAAAVSTAGSPVTPNAAPTTGAPTPGILSVALPPYARLRWDMDARDEDILGVVKSFFRGFNGQSLKDLLNWMRTSSAGTGQAPGANMVASPRPARDLDRVAAVQLLSDADLGTMLRDINHMRVVVFEMPRTSPRRSSTNRATAARGAANRPVPQSVVSYYEQRYLAGEGGRRIVRGDFDDVQMLTVGFPGRGFAMVFQAPGMGVVIRADGYPNFEGIGPFVMATLLRFAPSDSPNKRSDDDD